RYWSRRSGIPANSSQRRYSKLTQNSASLIQSSPRGCSADLPWRIGRQVLQLTRRRQHPVLGRLDPIAPKRGLLDAVLPAADEQLGVLHEGRCLNSFQGARALRK